MAVKTKEMGVWRAKRSDVPTERRARVLTAAAQRLDLDSKVEAQRQRLLRQNWQLTGWSYYDSIPELGYAIDFIAHCTGRMRIFVAALSENGTTDLPTAIDDPTLNAPPLVIEACTNALRDLGNGRTELAAVMETLSVNTSVTGESFLLGQQDPATGVIAWSVRSIEEIVIYNDQVMLREGPMTNQGLLGLVPLNPAYTFVTRMWAPHPRFRLLAQANMRRLANTCEDLLILRRIIRATGRSRIAGRGILLIPNELDLPILNDDNQSLSADDFISKLTDAMITPIRNEGDASGVVPLVIEGPGDTLDKVRWIDFASTFDEQAGKVREELVENIAVGLDIPAEVILGIAEAARWTAYQVSTDTFRQHIEPHVVTLVKMITTAFLRPYFANCGLDQELVDAWLQRITVWYDPTELVTPTDLSVSAQELYDRGALSHTTLRRVSGFTEEDAPSADEFLAWLISKQRTWPVNVSEAVIHGLDPTLAVPPVVGPPALPGIKPGPAGGVVDASLVEAGPPVAAEQASPLGASEIGRLLRQMYLTETRQFALTAAAPPVKPSSSSLRLSRALGQIDRDLMARLKVATNDAVLEQLRKAGGRVIAKVKSEPSTRTKIAMTKKEHVMMLLGQEAVERTGLTAASLVASDWDGLKEQYYSWTGQAQKAALEKAAQLAKKEPSPTAVAAMAAGLDAGWLTLQSSLNTISEHAAYNPNPNVSNEDAIAQLNPDTIVPAGVVRAAIAVAGGAAIAAFVYGVLSSGASVPLIPASPVGGIGTGDTVASYLSDAGATTANYTWQWGGADHPFAPHEDLDGVEFDSWDDPLLDITGDFPSGSSYRPGDHDGCTCTIVPNWVTQDDVDAAQAASE